MKIKVNHFSKEVFIQKLNHFNNIDFSLFVDAIPENQDDLSSINILVLQEPNEYFGLHDWAIQNKDLFSVILTWDDKVLNNCNNALFLPFGHTWFKPDQYQVYHNKTFQLLDFTFDFDFKIFNGTVIYINKSIIINHQTFKNQITNLNINDDYSQKLINTYLKLYNSHMKYDFSDRPEILLLGSACILNPKNEILILKRSKFKHFFYIIKYFSFSYLSLFPHLSAF
jgi:hypothetical protein